MKEEVVAPKEEEKKVEPTPAKEEVVVVKEETKQTEEPKQSDTTSESAKSEVKSAEKTESIKPDFVETEKEVDGVHFKEFLISLTNKNVVAHSWTNPEPPKGKLHFVILIQ